MTIEEKARAYDEALERARKMLNMILDNELLGFPDQIREIFPQLCESEDERIRKALIDFFQKKVEKGFEWIEYGIPNNAVLSYLEKQKEQPMSAEEVFIRAGLKPYRDGNQWCVLAGGNIQEGICGFGDTIDEALYQFLMEVLKIQEEQKPLSTEETERNSIAFLEQLGYNCIPPGSEQQPAEWSEEDELMRNACITFIKDEKFKGYERSYECIDWLKSLRPSWKPEGQQLDCLRHMINVSTVDKIDKQFVIDLYEQLKKL